MENPEPRSGGASVERDFAGSDLDRLMSEARDAQAENPVKDTPVKPPNLFVWTGVAISLVLISLAIHFFWPVS